MIPLLRRIKLTRVLLNYFNESKDLDIIVMPKRDSRYSLYFE